MLDPPRPCVGGRSSSLQFHSRGHAGHKVYGFAAACTKSMRTSTSLCVSTGTPHVAVFCSTGAAQD